MADIPKMPLEGTSLESVDNMPMLTMTQDDGGGGLQAVLLRAIHEATVAAQRLGSLRVARNDVRNVTVLASLERTATTTSETFTNKGARGIIITFDITAIAAGSVRLSLVSGPDFTEKIFEAAAAISGVNTVIYRLYPNVLAGLGILESNKLLLPATWRVTITHATADAATYSVSGSYLI